MYTNMLFEFKNRHKNIPIIAGATTIIKFKDYFIFALSNQKYWKKEGKNFKIGYSGVGGKIEEDESPKDTALREIKEEISQNATLLPVKYTKYIKEDGQKTILKSKDNTAFITEFISSGIPGNPNKPGEWGLLLLIFLVRLKISLY